jgi:molybdopterin/thiamine biosynthesis adenylyltransferase/rhodanese-related sulfurtransferase
MGRRHEGHRVTDRYARQIVLAEVGPAGQARLAAARVVVVGAGGLGSFVLPELAGAGIGHITIVDHDSVEVSNLHRQPLFRMADLGRPKAEAARDALLAYNPDITIEARVEKLRPGNAAAIVAGADIVVDAADSLAATYMLGDACHAAGIPFVSASVLEQRGYAGAYSGGAPSYRAVFPDMPSTIGSCAANGVLGPVVGVLGSLEAHMALQIALLSEPSPLGRVVTVDLKTYAFGGFRFDGAEEGAGIPFIERGDIDAEDTVVELRPPEEAPEPVTPDAIRASVADIQSGFALPEGHRVVFACASGIRAHRAARAYLKRGPADVALVAAG